MSEEWPSNDFSRLETVYGPLAGSVRRLIDISIRTAADPATVAAAKSKIDSAAEELSASLQPGSFGVQLTPDGETIAWGNVVVGLRNPVAPPLVIHHEPDGLVWSEFVLGAAYEGPPGHVHGGVCSLILDHVLGATAHQPLQTRLHRHPHPPLPAQDGAWTAVARGGSRRPHRWRQNVLDRPHRRRRGPTVEAEGIFISPKQTPA